MQIITAQFRGQPGQPGELPEMPAPIDETLTGRDYYRRESDLRDLPKAVGRTLDLGDKSVREDQIR